MERYCTIFGRGSIAMLLADREPIGAGWFKGLENNDIPFIFSLRAHNRLVTRPDGCRVRLETQITQHRLGRRRTATLDGRTRPLHFAALRPKGGDGVVTTPNRPGHDALAPCCKRWAVETLFGNTKTRMARRRSDLDHGILEIDNRASVRH